MKDRCKYSPSTRIMSSRTTYLVRKLCSEHLRSALALLCVGVYDRKAHVPWVIPGDI